MEIKYSLKWTRASMDDWQKELLSLVKEMIIYQKDKEKLKLLIRNFILLCGRQVGKSEIVSFCLALILLNIPKLHLLIVSGVERQASGLYNKSLALIETQRPSHIKRGKDKPLRTVFKLKNGSILRTEPLGLDGSGARQHTLNGVVFEEMQLIPEEAFAAITPMLMTTGGFIWMLGTAWNTEGYVYDRLSDTDFKVVRVNAEEVAEKRPEPNRTIMLSFLEKERKRLTEAQYMQEYMAIPSDRLRQIFPDALIKRQQKLKRTIPKVNNRYVMGIDPAGLGEDEGAITILDTEDKEKIKQSEFIISRKQLTTETTDQILKLDILWDSKKIFVDDGGVGFGVFSELITNDQTKNKTISLNNSQRSLNKEDTKRKRILKEDLYINLLRLMERGQIELLDDPEIRESLKSCKFEYHTETKKLLITSTYNHPVESLIRAAWDAQEKDLNLEVYSIKV